MDNFCECGDRDINKGDRFMKLAGKVALVTGGATGIGRATAELFAEEGALVYIVDYNAAEGAAAVEAIEAAGGKAHFCATDVRSEESVKKALAQVAEGSGHIDVAVLAAGVLKGAFKKIDELSEEDWDATIDTNLKGTFLTAKYAAPLLEKARQSVLLLIASGAGVRGASSSYAYAASKAGMHGMHFKLEQELGPLGVRLHVICPGGIATPLKLENVAQGAAARGLDPEEAKRNANLGDPLGVARVLTFLASEEGSYVRGTIFTR
jgi:NAD(P)-dependent dehydrogenase (short-subunit alcohol dehydrogenase family)